MVSSLFGYVPTGTVAPFFDSCEHRHDDASEFDATWRYLCREAGNHRVALTTTAASKNVCGEGAQADAGDRQSEPGEAEWKGQCKIWHNMLLHTSRAGYAAMEPSP